MTPPPFCLGGAVRFKLTLLRYKEEIRTCWPAASVTQRDLETKRKYVALVPGWKQLQDVALNNDALK